MTSAHFITSTKDYWSGKLVNNKQAMRINSISQKYYEKAVDHLTDCVNSEYENSTKNTPKYTPTHTPTKAFIKRHKKLEFFCAKAGKPK